MSTKPLTILIDDPILWKASSVAGEFTVMLLENTED